MREQLVDSVYELLDRNNFDKARCLIKQELESIIEDSSREILFYKIKLYGILIDIGDESQCESDLQIGIDFLENNQNEILECISEASFYYNLANAKHGLGRIFYSNNRGVHSIDIIKEKFQEPINLYWNAYKKTKENEENLFIQISINLSNALVTVGRIVEAMQFLDIVLREEPNYPQALVSRADNLHYLTFITSCSVSKALYYQIYKDYDNAIINNKLPTYILQRCNQGKEQIKNILKSYGSKIEDFINEPIQTQKEFQKHSHFRKFCISNFLTLNEHTIYCECVASEKDDLQIGVPHAIFKGEIMPKLELLLNRLKSEFSLARWLYYQSINSQNIDFDVKYSELLDGEIITSKSELLRTSFRICYGLMDKIALGICKLYNLDSKRIYFESFWNDSKRKEEINKLKNVHLNALYSIACDLNSQNGELKHFKNWRNKLEHNLLILSHESENFIDVLKLYEDSDFVAIVDFQEFKNKTLHLLQLTRAAIFSFAYCVRIQTIDYKENAKDKPTFKVDFK